MSEERVWILKLGDAVDSVVAARGDFDDWIAAGLGLPAERLAVSQVHRAEPLPELESVAAVVLSGSAAMVTEGADWSERTAAWLAPVVEAERPVLGICYGHQLLARAFGGVVADNPRGREIGTVSVTVDGTDDDPLFGALPASLCVQASHVQSVVELPEGAVRLAANAADENHAFRMGSRCWGVQFHPEFDADIMRGYLRERHDVLAAEGLDPESLSLDVSDSTHGEALLRRFGVLASGG